MPNPVLIKIHFLAVVDFGKFCTFILTYFILNVLAVCLSEMLLSGTFNEDLRFSPCRLVWRRLFCSISFSQSEGKRSFFSAFNS